jgi:hypothetical protein
VFVGVDLWLENVVSCTGQNDEASLLVARENTSVNSSLLPQIQTHPR